MNVARNNKLTIEEMKTGEPIISPIRLSTYLSCRASEQEAAISVTDKLEVLVAKIHSGLIISPHLTFKGVKEDVLGFIIQELEQVSFDFETLDDSLHHQIRFFDSFRPIQSVSRSRMTNAEAQRPGALTHRWWS